MNPNPKNFCGGNFQDWIEVNLTDKCNGKCSWCIEKQGFHPSHHASWIEIARAALSSNKKNIILLGGEPTLFKDIELLIIYLQEYGKNIFVTTNGSKLLDPITLRKLLNINGINISIHHYDLSENKKITGIDLNEKGLKKAIGLLNKSGVPVRFNCNCISGHIDSKEKIIEYIRFAKKMGAEKVRFAELKIDEDHFVDLSKVFNFEHGLNDDPFKYGCHQDAVIEGMPVSFRQMCGLQNSLRKKPKNPKLFSKQVLYYDGIIYDGWQTKAKEVKKEGKEMTKEIRNEISKILDMLKRRDISKLTAINLIAKQSEIQCLQKKQKQKQKTKTKKGGFGGWHTVNGGCNY